MIKIIEYFLERGNKERTLAFHKCGTWIEFSLQVSLTPQAEVFLKE